MAFVAQPTYAGMTVEQASPWESLKVATQEFESVLTDEQCAELRNIKNVPDSDAVMVFTAQLDASIQSRRGTSIATRLHSVLQSVQQFVMIIDTVMPSQPDIAALVWASVKFAMLLVSNYESYFEGVSKVFMRFNSYCPRFDEYQALFPTSARLQGSLCKFHVSIIHCCKHAVEAIQRPWQYQLLNVFRQSFDQEFESDIVNIKNSGKEVRDEIRLAQIQTERQYQELHIQSQTAVSQSLRSVVSRSKRTNKKLEEMQIAQHKLKSRERSQRLLESLSIHDYSTPFREACKIRHPNTARWILSMSQFNSWCTQDTRLLWCSGKIGSGKTVVTASAIQHIYLTKSENTCVTYFFVQYNNSESLKAETIFRSIIRQSLNSADLSNKTKVDLETLENNRFYGMEKVAEVLLNRIIEFDLFYILLDGLDECSVKERRVLYDELSSLISLTPKLKVFFASRISLQGELTRKFPCLSRISMESSGAAFDIPIYIEEIVQQRMLEGQLVIGDQYLVEEIKNKLTKHADGMFLWVSYLIDELCDRCTDAEVRNALENLPRSLRETYYRVLSRVTPGRSSMVQKIFKWVAATKRRLTIDELSEAVSIEIGQKSSNPERRLNRGESIVLWCENLLQINEENEAVQFAHQSIHEFITGACTNGEYANFHVCLQENDHHVGELCITYLHFDNFQTTLATCIRGVPGITPASIPTNVIMTQNKMANSARRFVQRKIIENKNLPIYDITEIPSYERGGTDEALESLQAAYPFLNYASEHWISHTKTFQNGVSVAYRLWRRMISDGHGLAKVPWPQAQGDERNMEVLQWAVRAEHVALVRLQINESGVRKEYQEKSMIQAALLGNLDVLQVFLEHKQSSYALDRSLQMASKHGHLAIVNRLLAMNAQVNADGELEYGNHTALQAAARHGHLEVVECLLAAGADINDQVSSKNPICSAAMCNTVDPKVEHECSVIEGPYTALQAAARGGYEDVVELLLESGAKVDADPAPIKGLTALQAAAKHGHLHIIEHLIRHEANTNDAPAENGGFTALQGAALHGHFEVVKSLVEAGARITDSPAKHMGLSALQAAAKGGYLEIVDYLLVKGAGVNQEPGLSCGLSALQAAALNGHIEVVWRLYEKGADINAPGASYKGLTALEAATQGGHLKVVEFLLAQTAKLDAEPSPGSGKIAGTLNCYSIQGLM